MLEIEPWQLYPMPPEQVAKIREYVARRERLAAAEALREGNRRLAAARYVDMGGLPWVGREHMFRAVNDAAEAVLGEQWVVLMREGQRPEPAPADCPVCSAPDCHCPMCSMIADGDVPESYGRAHVAAEHGGKP